MQEPRVGDCAEFGIAEKLRKGRGKKIIRECVLLEEKMAGTFFQQRNSSLPGDPGYCMGTGYRVPGTRTRLVKCPLLAI